MKNTNFNFGLRVKELLAERNTTTAQFLKATGIPNQRFYDWCNKGAIPNVITAMEVARYFDLTVEQLVGDSSINPADTVINSLQGKLNKIKTICG